MTPSGKDCLQRMADRYASCRSYRDRGTATATFIEGDQRRQDSLSFTIAFVRPDGFRFHFEQTPRPGERKELAVWLEDGKARFWWTVGGEEAIPSLDLALAGATGVSKCSAHIVPQLLLPDLVSGWSLAQLQDPVVTSSESLGGRACHVVTGGNSCGVPMNVFLDAATWLIRRITQPAMPLYDGEEEDPEFLESLRAVLSAAHFETYIRWLPKLRDRNIQTEDLLDYTPEFDASIQPTELRFTPPA